MSRRTRRSSFVALVLTLVLSAGVAAPGARADAPGPQPEDGPAPAGANDWTCQPSAAHPRPVVLVHGLGATGAENWGYASPQLAADGYCVFALTYGERPDFPYFGGVLPMPESAEELDTFVDRVLAATGAAEVDLVGHSEGTVMPQWWLKFLGGAAVTHRYVALTPLYQGTTVYGLSDLVEAGDDQPAVSDPVRDLFGAFCQSCDSFLAGSEFLQALYGDGVYAVPGVEYTTLMTRYDELVVPYTSGYLDAPNATNFVLQDLCPGDLSEHAAVAFDPVVLRLIQNALDPSTALPVTCGPVLGLRFGTVAI